MSKRTAIALLLLFLALAFMYEWRQKQLSTIEPLPATFGQRPENSTSAPVVQSTRLPKQTNPIINENAPWSSKRTLAIPEVPTEVDATASAPVSAPALSPRAISRKKREGLPMGVVLWDNVPIYDAPNAKTELFRTTTGDFVRVFPDANPSFWHVQPGLDLYLAATTKQVEPAGERFPDKDGWIRKSDLNVFEPADAKEFIMELSPVTLGNDPSFSTLSFYDRAMKNPDPVVHRVVGPRIIALVSLHEDYSSSWKALYRDPDPKIRDAALAALNERGLANNRNIIEDLIVRLTELTKTPAKDETELEVLSILGVLKATHHPRVPAALASFKDAWKQTQSARINSALTDILIGN